MSTRPMGESCGDLGVILLVIGLPAGISVLTTIGATLIVVGLIRNLVPIRVERRLYY